jgi:hypothetical protein
MERWIKPAVTLLLIAAILYIVVSPVIDLPGSLLRRHRLPGNGVSLAANIISMWTAIRLHDDRDNLVPRWHDRCLTSGDVASRIPGLLC